MSVLGRMMIVMFFFCVALCLLYAPAPTIGCRTHGDIITCRMP